jgi:hypothetical protein
VGPLVGADVTGVDIGGALVEETVRGSVVGDDDGPFEASVMLVAVCVELAFLGALRAPPPLVAPTTTSRTPTPIIDQNHHFPKTDLCFMRRGTDPT